MWIVLKYKKHEFNFLKQGFKRTLGDMPLIFRPKIKYQQLIGNKFRFLENDILGDYLICYHEKFKKSKLDLKIKIASLKHEMYGYTDKNFKNEDFVKLIRKTDSCYQQSHEMHTLQDIERINKDIDTMIENFQNIKKG